MEWLVFSVSVFASIYLTNKYIFNITNVVVISKIAVYRTITKLIIGLLAGFLIGTAIATAQHFNVHSTQLTVGIVVVGLVLTALTTILMYKLILKKVADKDASIFTIFKALVGEFAVQVTLAIAIAVVWGLCAVLYELSTYMLSI